MNLTHPDAPKHVIETDNPEPYVSQGWTEVIEKPEKPKSAPKASPPSEEG